MSETLASMDDGRRALRVKGKARKRAAPRRPLGERLADLGVGTVLVALLAGSLTTALWPSGFATEAPIQLAPPPEIAAAPVVPEAGSEPVEMASGPSIEEVSDPRPLGALGEVRGSIGSRRPATRPGAAKVIEIPKDGAARNPGPIIVRDPSDVRQPPRIAHLPDRSLIEEGPSGPLPVTASGRRPLDVYAGRWSGRRGKRIAIVVGGIGISQTGSKDAIESLPGKVTLGFSPAGNSLQRWMQMARRDGHELLLQVPMQAFGPDAPDPRGQRLTLDASAAENGERLRASLGRLTNYVGVMNYTGGAFQADVEAMTPIMRELRERGLMYLDDGTSGQSQAVRVASDLAAPFAGADILLDGERRPAAIAKQLERLEEVARGTGRAIGVASAFPESIEAIARWIEGVESRGFEVVPVSALANDPGKRR